jgi:quercetin dioxygenase-like cupin family protein
MPVVPAPAQPTHEAGPARFTSLATPSRGTSETCVWEVSIPPATPATPHSLTREEVFIVLAGSAAVRLDGRADTARTGDAIVVPAGVELELANAGDAPLRLLCCMPVGGQAVVAGDEPFTPPWAE